MVTAKQSQSELVLRRQASNLRSPYLRREDNAENDPAKQECRDRVVKYIISNHVSGGARILSLPSSRWQFERQFYEVYGRCSFIGLERESRIFHKSIPWMPGSLGRRMIYELKYQAGLKVLCAENLCCKLLNIDCVDFLRLRRTDLMTKEERASWTTKFRRWSAIWLDFTSMLCREVEICLGEISGGIDPTLSQIPVVITLMKGRELQDITNKMFALQCDRVGYVSQLIANGGMGRFDVDDVYEYQSCGGVTMYMVMGRIKPSDLKGRSHLFVENKWSQDT